jgi:hypothetical protein
MEPLLFDHRCYPTIIRIDGTDRVVFWESGGDVASDRVELDAAGFVITFPSEATAREVAAAEGRLLADEEAPLYDFDAIDAWCRSTETVRDCSQLLDAWNLLADLPRGDNLFASADARATETYDKLFFGCNLPSITPIGEHYVPVWGATELAVLKHLLLLGIAELRARLR